MHFFCWYRMHTSCNAFLVSQENLHVIQQENANDLQLSWNPAALPFIQGRLQKQQPWSSSWRWESVSTTLPHTSQFVLSVPHLLRSWEFFPNTPLAVEKVIFRQHFVSKRKAISSPFKWWSLKQYGLTSSSSTDYWVVGTATRKTSVPQLPTPPWPHQAGETLPGLTQTSDENHVLLNHTVLQSEIFEIWSFFRLKKN